MGLDQDINKLLEEKISLTKEVKAKLDGEIQKLFNEKIGILNEIGKLRIELEQQQKINQELLVKNADLKKAVGFKRDDLRQLDINIQEENENIATSRELLVLERREVAKESKKLDEKDKEIKIKNTALTTERESLAKGMTELARELDITREKRYVYERTTKEYMAGIDSSRKIKEQSEEIIKKNLELQNELKNKISDNNLHESVYIEKLKEIEKALKENESQKVTWGNKVREAEEQRQKLAEAEGSLTNSLVDIKNRENSVQIRELRVLKIQQDKDVDKELAKLKDSLKKK